MQHNTTTIMCDVRVTVVIDFFLEAYVKFQQGYAQLQYFLIIIIKFVRTKTLRTEDYRKDWDESHMRR